MQKTAIEWATHTWSPIKMRCTPVSAGCRNCWHLRMAKRHAANPTFSIGARAAYEHGSVYMDWEELKAPNSLKKPARIAVQLMGDLFNSKIPFQWLDFIFQAMPDRHTFIVLTKRPKRMLKYLGEFSKMPLNVWVGVSVENQATANERIPFLLLIPAAVRWLSVEPLLESVDLERAVYGAGRLPESEGLGLDMIVVGAETGPGKRPCKQEWIDNLRSQCRLAGVKFFGKVDQDGRPIMPREYPEAK